MRLQVFVPTRTLLDCSAAKIVAQAANGAFGLLPRHVDFVTALVPGILSWVDPDGVEHWVGTDEGILVKQARDVHVTTRQAIASDDLATLRQRLREEILMPDEQDRAARTALSRLEAGMIRRLMELQERSG